MKRMARFQQTLASQSSFEKLDRKSKRELFLDQMEQVVPWSALLALVGPYYLRAGNGRQPVGLAIMLRTYFLQQWFNLSDPGMEEAFYESPVLRRFAGVDLPPHGRRSVCGDPGWARPRCRTRPPSFVSATCWKSTIWAAGSWIP
jgi:hypothetical protein